MPDTDIGITALLLKLRSSNSRHNIAVNWLTTRRIQLENQAACSVGTSTSILPLEMHGDIEVDISVLVGFIYVPYPSSMCKSQIPL